MSNIFDRIGETTRLLLTASEQLRYQKERVDKLQADVDRLGDKLSTLSERVTRLEGTNENDRLQVSLELERFKLAVERHLITLQNPGLPQITATENEPNS